MLFRHRFTSAWLVLLLPLVLTGCLTHPQGRLESRKGDEIVAAGQFFHTGTKVVLWMDPGGYDAYRVQRRFAPIDQSGWADSSPHMDAHQPNRYGMRDKNLTDAEVERLRGGGWDLPTLQSNVDQFVLHFDVCGISRTCFNVLHDHRDLSVHFMLDVDGTIYQTLDLKEAAWHATTSNNRSVGVEIANMGAYGENAKDPLAHWYKTNSDGRTVITFPTNLGVNPVRTPHFTGHPARKGPVTGEVQGKVVHQFDYTKEQYKALAKLTATLCAVFPKINCDYPRDEQGRLLTHKLPADELKKYHGVMGHYHVQTNKDDPGPALQWDYVIGEARHLLKLPPVHDEKGNPVPFGPKLIVDN